jgi:hypothetical protein
MYYSFCLNLHVLVQHKMASFIRTCFQFMFNLQKNETVSRTRDCPRFLPVATARAPCLHAAVHIRNHKLNPPNDQAPVAEGSVQGLYVERDFQL